MIAAARASRSSGTARNRPRAAPPTARSPSTCASCRRACRARRSARYCRPVRGSLNAHLARRPPIQRRRGRSTPAPRRPRCARAARRRWRRSCSSTRSSPNSGWPVNHATPSADRVDAAPRARRAGSAASRERRDRPPRRSKAVRTALLVFLHRSRSAQAALVDHAADLRNLARVRVDRQRHVEVRSRARRTCASGNTRTSDCCTRASSCSLIASDSVQ